MTELEVTKVILKVAKRVAHRYTFAYYDKDDIEQEAFIIGVEALENYDSEHPLENFLSIHIPNRLKNLKRNKYFRLNKEDDIDENRQFFNRDKRNLMEPIHLKDNITYDEKGFDRIEEEEILTIIKEDMPPTIRSDFSRMASGVTISQSRKERVLNYIEDLDVRT